MMTRTLLLLGGMILPVAAALAADAEHVMPDGPQGMGYRVPAVADPGLQERCDRIYVAAQRLARHLLEAVKPWSQDPALLLATESRSKEHWIRPNAGLVCGLAFLYQFGPYDDKVVGMPRAQLLRERILPMICYLTSTHVTGPRVTGDGKPWGDAWQSALWAQLLGRAAWYLGSDQPADTARDVQRVIAHEADRIAAAQPPHQLANDTKAEENAWNSTILNMAVLLMPDDTRRAGWEAAFQRWALSSFLRPADEHAASRIDGRPVRDQFAGANIYDDFTLENHRLVHPDYMTTWSLLLCSALDYAMTGRPAPEALRYNIGGIYENLIWFALPDGGFVYPSGQDWTLFRNPDWTWPHYLMAVFGDRGEAWTLADRSLEALERMQARTPSGRVYLADENFFASAETDLLWELAQAWLALHFAPVPAPASAERVGVRRLEHARLLLNRTPSAVHTLSWGTAIMAQCVPLQLDRVVSPHVRSGVGYVRVAGQERPPEVVLREARVEHRPGGFHAQMVVDHGEFVRAALEYRSHVDGTFEMRERLTAICDVQLTEVATGLVGVLNNRDWIHERGERTIALDAAQTHVAALSGSELRGDGVRRVSVDGVLHISSRQPLAVSYRAASRPERGRATDLLLLNHHAEPRRWRAGETISSYDVRIRCARATAAPR